MAALRTEQALERARAEEEDEEEEGEGGVEGVDWEWWRAAVSEPEAVSQPGSDQASSQQTLPGKT